MTTPAHLSPIQYVEQPDGSMALKDLPHLTLEAIQEQGAVVGRDWQSELNLPPYYEDYEAMAQVEGLSEHRLAFVLLDEAPTHLPGSPRMSPRQVTLPQTAPLELGHSGFVVGVCHAWVLGFGERRREIAAMFGIALPSEIEGEWIVGYAQLFQSRLAERAWEGVHREIFTHVCPNILRPHGAPAGTGTLVQTTIAPGDFPGLANARILRAWDHA